MADDILSDVLKMVRLSGALMFRFDLSGPWNMTAARTDAVSLAPLLPAGTNHVIVFHVVSQGECWVRRPPGEWVKLRAGEAVILPHGDAHALANRPDMEPVPFQRLLAGRSPLDVRVLRYETGTEPKVQILCGFLGCNQRAFSPLCTSLPELFTVPLAPHPAALVRYAVDRAQDEGPGTDSLRVRVAELLFMEALRQYMHVLPDDATGWLAGLRDPLVGGALRLLHRSPHEEWNVDALAARVNSSRSALAARFTEVLGEAPMHYLARWRMYLAARQLTDSRRSVAAIAAEVGYDSPAAFQRAFKRHFGIPPAAWRSNPAGDVAPARRHERRVRERRRPSRRISLR